MAIKRREFTKEFKQQVVRELEAGATQAQAARQYQLHLNPLLKWRQLQRQYAENAFAGNALTFISRRMR